MPSTLFQRLETLSECGLIPPLVASGFVDFHPGHVSSAVFAGLRSLPRGDALDDERPPLPVHSTRRKPSLQTRPPEAAGQIAASVRLRCKRRGHSLFRRQDLPGALLVLAPGTAPAGAGWPSLGSGRWPSADRLRRVHYARTRHAIPQGGMSCRLLCAPFTRGNADIFRPEARRKVGTSERKMLFPKICSRSIADFASLSAVATGYARMMRVQQQRKVLGI